jgi:hypothetical protein
VAVQHAVMGAGPLEQLGALFSDAMGRDTMPERYSYSQREAVERYVDLLVRAIAARPRARRRERGSTPS